MSAPKIQDQKLFFIHHTFQKLKVTQPPDFDLLQNFSNKLNSMFCCLLVIQILDMINHVLVICTLVNDFVVQFVVKPFSKTCFALHVLTVSPNLNFMNQLFSNAYTLVDEYFMFCQWRAFYLYYDK